MWVREPGKDCGCVEITLYKTLHSYCKNLLQSSRGLVRAAAWGAGDKCDRAVTGEPLAFVLSKFAPTKEKANRQKYLDIIYTMHKCIKNKVNGISDIVFQSAIY